MIITFKYGRMKNAFHFWPALEITYPSQRLTVFNAWAIELHLWSWAVGILFEKEA